ncbi:hypothetical protein R6Q57_011299 [Mikania cordata]
MRVLACDWPQYKELTLEFHSTFMYDDSEFDYVDAMLFALGRRVYKMSIPQFAVATGFYTQDEVLSPRFSTSLRGAFKKNKSLYLSEVDLSEFWGTIADSLFSTNMVEFEIRDPILRIAEFLGVFDRYRPDLMTMGPLTTPIDLRDLRKAGISERDEPPRWAGFVEGPQMMPLHGTVKG